MANKDELYLRALRYVANNYPDDSESGMALYSIAELLRGNTSGYLPVDQQTNTAAIPSVLAILDTIINRYPNTEAWVNAQLLKNGILAGYLSFNSESVILPNEYSKILVTYRNIPRVWVRIIPVSSAANLDVNWNNIEYYNAQIKGTLALPPLQSFSVKLPGSEDHITHTAEVKIGPMPPGRYVIVVGDNDSCIKVENKKTRVCGSFFASSLSLVMKTSSYDTLQGYTLNRKTGMPVGGVSVLLMDYKKKNAKLISDRNGYLNNFVPADFVTYRYFLYKGKDTLFCGNQYGGRNNRRDDSVFRTFFMTDRSIYRPGQTLFFKGIYMYSKNGAKENGVLPGRPAHVYFRDANWTIIDSMRATTNEYGSFSGKFTIPENGLTGTFSLTNSYGSGSTQISVEEYKRPKFSVAFDPLKTDYSLNETVTVTGKAMAYSGAPIDGAKVTYAVQRAVQYPYYWLFEYYHSRSADTKEITHGTATADKDGNFRVTFPLQPDSATDPRTLPIFTYTVNSNVTDINGETHSANTSLEAGYVSTKIIADIPANPALKDLSKLHITTRNLAGEYVKKELHLKIYALRGPATPLRDRLWAAPDKYLMSLDSFKKYFPLDVYKDEDKKENWNKEATILDTTIVTSEKGIVTMPRDAWKKNGWYVAELETKDRNGQAVLEKKYLELSDARLPGQVNDPLRYVTDSNDETHAVTHVYTGFADSLYVLCQTQDMHDKITLSGQRMRGVLEDRRTFSAADRGGFVISYFTMKENRAYTGEARIAIPWHKNLDLSWETHRDKLLPGEKEQWTLTIKGDRGEKAAAEMAATLYDASLEALKPHDWHLTGLFPGIYSKLRWNYAATTSLSGGIGNVTYGVAPPGYKKEYDQLFVGSEFIYGYPRHLMTPVLAYSKRLVNHDYKAVYNSAMPGASYAIDGIVVMDGDSLYENTGAYGVPDFKDKDGKNKPDVSIRKNLQETAFFFPQLYTDEAGNVRFSFTMPEALTEWKLLAFAHTPGLSTGSLSGTVKTQKDLMVVPGLPRFLRQNDHMIITAKINNLSDHDLSGMAQIAFLDAATLKPLNDRFHTGGLFTFSSAKGGSALASWAIQVPDDLFEPVIVRISARAGTFTDGEENTLPVLSNRMMVTETMPMYVNGDTTRAFHFRKLEESGSSSSLKQYSLTVQYTGNPAWYALQALPYLMEFPHECAEQTFNRYYANAIGANIVQQNPRIEAIFRKWETEDTAALISNLEKNAGLKSALLSETPWVMQAKSETEQKHNIAMLFNAHKLARELDANLQKLEHMLVSGQGFPWFKGMEPDRYITQYILTGLEKLNRLGVKNNDGAVAGIRKTALPWIDSKILEDYSLLKQYKADTNENQLGYTQVQYLYLRSFSGAGPADGSKVAFAYYKRQAARYWTKFNPYMQGMIALSLWRLGDKATAAAIISSLRERAHHSDEMGMYWMEPGEGYYWYQSSVAAQALLIECFAEITKDTASIDAMKLWMLKQKQTQSWPTTTGTSDACYALLLTGAEWLAHEPEAAIQLGSQPLDMSSVKKEAGTGTFTKRYDAAQVQPQMGDVTVRVSGNRHGTSWGGVYWQYFEDMDKITGAATPLKLAKQLFVEKNTGSGPVLQPVTGNNPLHVGDKVTIRIELTADRDMEYIHLKDMRAACFEPVNVLSGYRYQGGTGYYESTKDASSNFFISYLPKGKYVFEYPVFVTAQGEFSNGISTIQCMYAPEFSSHSEGMRVIVK